MNIDKINPNQPLNPASGSSRSKPVGKVQGDPMAPSQDAKLSISDEGRRAFEQASRIDDLKEQVKALPDVRSEKMVSARELVDSGYFHTDEGIKKVADAVLNSTDAMALINPDINLEEALERIAKPSPERMQEVLNRIQQRFYDQPEIMQEVASRIVQDFENGSL